MVISRYPTIGKKPAFPQVTMAIHHFPSFSTHRFYMMLLMGIVYSLQRQVPQKCTTSNITFILSPLCITSRISRLCIFTHFFHLLFSTFSRYLANIRVIEEEGELWTTSIYPHKDIYSTATPRCEKYIYNCSSSSSS